MADVGTVSTDIYRPLQSPQQQQMQPLDVVRLIGGLQENQIRQRNMDALQAIGGAYNRRVSPTGDIDVPGLRSDIARNGGVLAAEGLSQATANSDADLKLRSGWQQTLRGIYGQFATLPNITDDHLAQAKVDAAGAGIPPAAIQQFVSTMPRTSNQKALKNWATTQSLNATGPTATTSLTSGPVNEQTGVRPLIPAGAAVRQAVNGGIVPELPIGEAKSREASTDTAIALRNRNAHYAEDMYPINGLIDSLEKVGPKGSGPGKEELNTLKSALYAFSDWVPGLDKQLGDPELMGDFTKGVKFAKQLASSVANNVGPHTNEGLTTAFASSPNMNMLNLPAKDLAKSIYGLRNMQQVMMIQAQKEGVPDSGLTRWAQNNWSLRVNPAGFMWDRLDDSERDRVIHKVEMIKDPNRRAAEMTKLRNSVELATRSGVIAGPQQ
jgi:hypothetical protein